MVRTGPWLGLLGVVALLAGLALTLHPYPRGLLLAGCYGLGLTMLLRSALNRSGATSFGSANAVTLVRAVLVGGVLALVIGPLDHPVAIAALSTSVLVLDNLDGRVARSTQTVSTLGARFDLEVDAFLILVLSLGVARTIGWWVLTIGAARYLLVVAAWRLAWLRVPTPPRYWCKVVAVVQGVGLTAVLTGLLSHLVAVALTAIALMLGESFGREVWQKWRERAVAQAPQPILRPRRSAGRSWTTHRHRMPCTGDLRRPVPGQD